MLVTSMYEGSPLPRHHIVPTTVHCFHCCCLVANLVVNLVETSADDMACSLIKRGHRAAQIEVADRADAYGVRGIRVTIGTLATLSHVPKPKDLIKVMYVAHQIGSVRRDQFT